MSDRRIRTIAVVGDGIAGWSAAAALKRRVANVSVALVPVTGLAPGMAELTGIAAPSIGDFHGDIGLQETDVVRRTGAAYRLGTCYSGWRGEGSAFVHAYGPAGFAHAGVGFAALWTRAGAPRPYQSFSPGAVLGDAGRFLPSGAGVLSGYAHGLRLDMPVYRQFIAAYARHLGVLESSEPLAESVLADGHIAALRLADASELSADLYVDATDGAARLIGALAPDDPREDWSQWLGCTQLAATDSAIDPALPSLDHVEATADGWVARIALPGRSRVIRATSGSGASSGTALRSGRRTRAWIGNVVAIGEAHTVIEPLEGAPLHLLHSQIDRLVCSLPDRDFAQVELDHYNRDTAEEADRLRDFLIALYVLSDRPEPFWRARAEAALPPLLAEALMLFRERGRLPLRDGESLDKDSWLALLLGQGIVPRRYDPLTAELDPDTLRTALADYAARLEQAAARAPLHRAFLETMRNTP